MTIRFLVPKDGYAAGYSVSNLPPSVEAAYVASGVAVYAQKDLASAFKTDPTTGNVIGIKDADGGERLLGGVPNLVTNSANRLNYRKAMAKVLSGGRARLLIAGDSTTVGAGAGTNGTGATGLVGARTKNWPTQLAAALTAAGIPAWNQSVWGDQNVGSAGETYNSYDPRVSPGSWGNQFLNTLGGKAWTVSSAAAAFAFTPTMTFDRFDVYTVQNSGLGSITVNVDGGATLATINEAGSASVVKTTVTCTRGTHTINVVSSSSTAVYLLGIVPWDSTLGGLDIIQCGHWGGSMGNIANNANPWEASSSTLLNAIAPDISLVQLTINDANGGTALSTYTSQLATVESALGAASGDVILMSGLLTNNAATTNGTLAGMVSAVSARAAAQSRLFADLGSRCGSFAAMNAAGFMYTDGTHGSALMYGDEGRWLANSLVQLAA